MTEIFHQLLRLRSFFNRKDKLQYLLLLGMMLVGALLDIIGIGAIPAFVALLSMPEKLQQQPFIIDLMTYFGLKFGSGLIIKGSVVLIIVFLIKNAYVIWFYNQQYKIIEYHRIRLADRLFSAYMYAPYTFHLKRNSAELLRNIQVETLEIVRTIISPVLEIIMGILMTLFTFILLMLSTPWIGLGAIFLIGGGSTIFYSLIRKRVNTYGQIAKVEWKESVKAINQGIGALVESKVLGKESYFIDIFKRSIANFARVERLRQVVAKSSPAILESIAVTGLLLGVILMLFIGMDTQSMLPILALFGVAAVRLRQSVAQIVNGLSQLQYGIIAIPHVMDDIQHIESTPQYQIVFQNANKSIDFQHIIELKNISYTYPATNTAAINNINVTIRKGESIAFVGPTGSGKSTIVNILLGLLEPQSGIIQIDGVNINDNLRGWLRHIGYIPQTIFLLDDTIRRNIALGISDSDINDAKIWEAINAAQLYEFIQSLPDGLNTIVGERGVRLSGGQRQRVGLARALYHNPEILVMDEATSSLDNHTESLVMQALEQLKEGRTFIMIAHRLSTVQQCDRLYFLKDGIIEASGSYEDLLIHHAEFRQIAELD